MYDCLALGCAEKGLCGSTQCNRWVKYLKGEEMKESAIQKKIIDYINTIGYCIKVQSANKRGVPDIIACVPNDYGVGVFYAFEVKNSDGGIVSELQKYNLIKIQESGGFGYVVNSLEQVKNALNKNSEVF